MGFGHGMGDTRLKQLGRGGQRPWHSGCECTVGNTWKIALVLNDSTKSSFVFHREESVQRCILFLSLSHDFACCPFVQVAAIDVRACF